MKRILVVAQDFPYPPTDGARADVWGRLQSLKRLGYAIDLLATVKRDPSNGDRCYVEQTIGSVVTVKRSRGWRSILSLRPFQLVSRYGLRRAVISGRYDAVVLESEYVASVLKNKGLDARLRILRVHNDSARNFEQLAKSETSLLRKLFYRMEATKARMYFGGVTREFDLLWFISNDEYREFMKVNPDMAEAASFLPPAVNAQDLCLSPRNSPRSLFIGTLGLAPNARAAEWYLKNVHARLSGIPQYGFDIAGNTLGMSIDSIRSVANVYKNVTLTENPTALADLYRNASVFVNPVFHGTGVKLKTILAVQAGLPVVTTTIGAEGCGLLNEEHLLIADHPQEFAAAVRRLLSDSGLATRLVAASQQFLRINYNHDDAIGASLRHVGSR
jgi:glycosyltransferase involved in cell wall biosynthesis